MFILNMDTSFFTMLPKPDFFNLHQCCLPFRSEEASAFNLLDQFMHPGEWTYQQWQELQGNYFLCGLIKNGENDCLAAGLLGTNPTEGEGAHLLKVVVHPDLRHRGGATRLLEFYLTHLCTIGSRSLYLEVAMNNIGAIAFYRKHGFKDLCVKKKFYKNGEDALSMELLLGEELNRQ